MPSGWGQGLHQASPSRLGWIPTSWSPSLWELSQTLQPQPSALRDEELTCTQEPCLLRKKVCGLASKPLLPNLQL